MAIPELVLRVDLGRFVGMHLFGHGGCGGGHGGMARMTTRAGRGRPVGIGTRGDHVEPEGSDMGIGDLNRV